MRAGKSGSLELWENTETVTNTSTSGTQSSEHGALQAGQQRSGSRDRLNGPCLSCSSRGPEKDSWLSFNRRDGAQVVAISRDELDAARALHGPSSLTVDGSGCAVGGATAAAEPGAMAGLQRNLTSCCSEFEYFDSNMLAQLQAMASDFSTYN
jgi:hypothetical protein